ncbi:hypothetical protein ACFFRR_005584 [Megaselia abdita]
MSQMKKSASFRSRIPIRRRLPQHRTCISPKISFNTGNIFRAVVRKTRQRYSSSSFSSGDESCGSELTANKSRLPRNFQQYNLNKQHLIYRSADTISLDGQLDSISTCGSFSSPPSPENKKKPIISQHSTSYESLDKYNLALESFNLTDLRENFMIYSLVSPNSDNLRIRKTTENKNNKMIMMEIINSKTIIPIESSFEDVDNKTNKSPKEWYYVKNRTSENKMKPHTSITPQPKNKLKSAKKSPSMSSINMAPSNTLTFPSETFATTDDNTKHEKNNLITKETIQNPNNTKDFIRSANGDSLMYDRIEMRNERYAHYTKPDPYCLNVDSFRQNQEYWQDIATKGLTQRQLQQQNNLDRAENAVRFENNQQNCQKQTPAISHKQTHPTGINNKSMNNEQQQKYTQIENFPNFDKHKFPSYFSGLPHKNISVAASGLDSVNSSLVGRISQHSPTSSPLTRTVKFIPKRFDETSCGSSFEQLNIIGIPTTISTTSSFQKQCTSQTQSSSHNAINKSKKQTNSNYDIQFGINSIERMQYSYEPKKRRPLPKLPIETMIFPPKTTGCRSECELSGSYASLECPSPPGPPVCLPESRRDPQARLSTYLKTLYSDLALKDPVFPPWSIPIAPGSICPARQEPDLKLHSQSHGFSDTIGVDQILISIQIKDGSILEAPQRVLIECPPWSSRGNFCLRILHAWAKEPPWPVKGTPVALTLFIPLSELKRGFANYIEKELLPKGPLNPFSSGFNGFAAAWNSLEALGPKLLILLDGYDTQKSSPKRKGRQYPSDVHDFLEGKIFPEARTIITTSAPGNSIELLPIVQRHLIYEGITWGRSASILLGGGQWGGPSRLLDTVQECPNLRNIVRTPLGCLAVSALFESITTTGDGDLPTEELDVIESILNCVTRNPRPQHVAELGRLAMFCLKMRRPFITLAELRMYCSSPESTMMGCLDKNLLVGKAAKKKGEFVYNFICPNMAEFLAASYLASLVNRPGLLAAEITGLAIGGELDMDLLKVIRFSMGLLGPRSHVLISKLTPLWLPQQIIFSLALAGGNTGENLSALCDILGISRHPPLNPFETKPIFVQVRSIPIDLLGWGMALKSNSCTLKNLEIIYQMEKHNNLETRNAVDVFLDSLGQNESIITLRFSSLIEIDVKDAEINYLANCVSKVLLKPRLENFELVLTLLEEDPPILKLQPVITAICRAITKQAKLSFLLLDLGLSTSQLVQICGVIEKCPNITRICLPHLKCERGAIASLSTLLNARPMHFLSLPSCWGARDDPPSSSGVSMGSGSGSSTGTSGLIKQGSLPGVPSPRSYPPGLFSSLPRGIYVPTATLGRSATLPRQPIEPPIDKRSCDSVVSKSWYPTPACEGGPHSSGTLHDLLLAAREPYSKLNGLDLSKAQLSLEDSMCLGETVRISTTLHTLKLEGCSRLSEILPSIIGASESMCIQMLSIGSPRLNLEDSAISMCSRALTTCSTLRLLSLDGWSFRIENSTTLLILRAFLSLTSIRELSLANCRLQIGLIKHDFKEPLETYECRSVVVMKLSGAQAILSDSTIIRGPQLLPFFGCGFPCLRELDISAPARSGLGSAHSSPLVIDDKSIITFFQNIQSYFSLLNTLKICNWVIHFDDLNKTLKTISKCIRNSPISHLKLDGISVLDRPRKQRIDSQFIHILISSLPLLRWFGISLSGKKEDQINAIGSAIRDLRGHEIDIKYVIV